MRPSKQQIAKMVSAVHGRVCQMFPMFVINGWRYRGFEPEEVGGIGVVVNLRFERAIRGRTAFIDVQIAEHSFNSAQFDLRGFITRHIQEQEVVLKVEREKQLDGVAA